MSALHFEDQDLGTTWMSEAACARIPGLPWTASDLRRVPPVLVEVMAETCHTCPVLERCAAFIDEAEICAGFWAGASQNHRGLSGQRASKTPARRPAVASGEGDQAA